RLLGVLSGMKRSYAGGLDRRSISHRIGEWHAQFDHIGAGFGQRLGDGERGIVVRIARHGKGHQRGAALLFKRGEALVDAGGHRRLLSRKAATESKSLSPRPERLTTIR